MTSHRWYPCAGIGNLRDSYSGMAPGVKRSAYSGPHPSCFAYSQRGQTGEGAPTKIGQPHSLQLMTGSPSIPRTIVPQRRPPQGPVPTPVRLLTCSKVFAPA